MKPVQESLARRIKTDYNKGKVFRPIPYFGGRTGRKGFTEMMKRGIALLAAGLMLTGSLAGCGKSDTLDGTQTVAVLDETTNVPLGEVSFLLRYQQAQMESYYGAMLGMTNMYNQDISGSGTIYGETAKENLMTQFNEMYVLEAEAANYGVELTDDEKTAISDAAAQFMEDNDSEVQQALGVSQADVEHVLTLLTIQEKMFAPLTADVDTEVSDEEAAQKRIAYVYVSTAGTETDDDGNTIDLTDEEKAAKKQELQEILDAAKESGDLQAAVDAANESREDDSQLSANETTYGADSTTPAEEIRTAADALKDGEFAEIIETDTGYYAVQMISTFDEDATATKKESILSERKNTLYEEQCTELEAAHTFETKDNVLAELTFDRNYTLNTSTTESTESTEE